MYVLCISIQVCMTCERVKVSVIICRYHTKSETRRCSDMQACQTESQHVQMTYRILPARVGQICVGCLEVAVHVVLFVVHWREIVAFAG